MFGVKVQKSRYTLDMPLFSHKPLTLCLISALFIQHCLYMNMSNASTYLYSYFIYRYHRIGSKICDFFLDHRDMGLGFGVNFSVSTVCRLDDVDDSKALRYNFLFGNSLSKRLQSTKRRALNDSNFYQFLEDSKNKSSL